MSLERIACQEVSVVRESASGSTRAILRSVDFVARRGEVTGITGATGAGKTTLLQLLAGLDRPSEGEVVADGEAISRWTAGHRDRWRRRVGFQFQGAELIEDLSAAENVWLPLIPRRAPAREKLARVEHVLDALELRALADQPARELSGGEGQRVALARAIVVEPDLLLLDEPSTHQDETSLGPILAAIENAKKRNTVVVLATHDPRLLESSGIDRLVHLDHGALVEPRGTSTVIPHPLLLGGLVCDLGTVLLLGHAGWTSARAVTSWETSSASRAQLCLERRVEVASFAARWAYGLFVLASLVFVVAVASVLPVVVPGAMCGTGVVQATEGLAHRALGLRLLAFLLLAVWRLADGLNRGSATAPLTVVSAKLLLLALPAVALAAFDTTRTLLALDLQTPVDCCAVVYDQVRSVEEATTSGGLSDAAWSWGSLIGGSGLLALAASLLLVRARGVGLRSVLVVGLALCWVPVSAVALVRVYSAYHYRVLHHHCPWCLFLPEHRLVGYPLFLALFVVLSEALVLTFAERFARGTPPLREAALVRARTAAWRIALAVALFALLAWVPALLWRWRHGVWMSG